MYQQHPASRSAGGDTHQFIAYSPPNGEAHEANTSPRRTIAPNTVHRKGASQPISSSPSSSSGTSTPQGGSVVGGQPQPLPNRHAAPKDDDQAHVEHREPSGANGRPGSASASGGLGQSSLYADANHADHHPAYSSRQPQYRNSDIDFATSAQRQHQPASLSTTHAPFVTTTSLAPARTAPHASMNSSPGPGWFAAMHGGGTPSNAHGSSMDAAQGAYLAHNISAARSGEDSPIIGHMQGSGYSPPNSQLDAMSMQMYQSMSSAPQQQQQLAAMYYANNNQARSPSSSTASPSIPPFSSSTSSTPTSSAAAHMTAGPLIMDGVPLPHHQKYYPRSAWGPPLTPREVEERLEKQRNVHNAQLEAMRRGAGPENMAFALGLSGSGSGGTINPSELSPTEGPSSGGAGAKTAPNAKSIELSNPTAGDLDDLLDGHDTDEKPPYPLATILKFTLLGSPRGKLTLAEIYETIVNRFPYYAKVLSDWQNSVRHTLSLHICFVRVNRVITDPGKGSYWTYEPSLGDGINRKRKAGKAKGEAETPEPGDAPPRRKPGRPPGSGSKKAKISHVPPVARQIGGHDLIEMVRDDSPMRDDVRRMSNTQYQQPYGINGGQVASAAQQPIAAVPRRSLPSAPAPAPPRRREDADYDSFDDGGMADPMPMSVDYGMASAVHGPARVSAAPRVPPPAPRVPVPPPMRPRVSSGLAALEYSSDSDEDDDPPAPSEFFSLPPSIHAPPVTAPAPVPEAEVESEAARQQRAEREQREAELRQRDLGELLELREAKKRKELERQQAAQRQVEEQRKQREADLVARRAMQQHMQRQQQQVIQQAREQQQQPPPRPPQQLPPPVSPSPPPPAPPAMEVDTEYSVPQQWSDEERADTVGQEEEEMEDYDEEFEEEDDLGIGEPYTRAISVVSSEGGSIHRSSFPPSTTDPTTQGAPKGTVVAQRRASRRSSSPSGPYPAGRAPRGRGRGKGRGGRPPTVPDVTPIPASKYLPVQRAPPVEHLKQVHELQTVWARNVLSGASGTTPDQTPSSPVSVGKLTPVGRQSAASPTTPSTPAPASPAPPSMTRLAPAPTPPAPKSSGPSNPAKVPGRPRKISFDQFTLSNSSSPRGSSPIPASYSPVSPQGHKQTHGRTGSTSSLVSTPTPAAIAPGPKIPTLSTPIRDHTAEPRSSGNKSRSVNGSRWAVEDTGLSASSPPISQRPPATAAVHRPTGPSHHAPPERPQHDAPRYDYGLQAVTEQQPTAPVVSRPRPRPQSREVTERVSTGSFERANGPSPSTQHRPNPDHFPTATGSRHSDMSTPAPVVPSQSTPRPPTEYSSHVHFAPSTTSAAPEPATSSRSASANPVKAPALLSDLEVNRAYIANIDPSTIKRGASGKARIPVDPAAIKRLKAEKKAREREERERRLMAGNGDANDSYQARGEGVGGSRG